MERAGDMIAAGLATLTAEPSCEPFSLDEYERRRMERCNAIPGLLNREDGYDCPECLNRGYFIDVAKDESGMWQESMRECSCMKVRANLRRIRLSGLQELLSRYSFESYEADTPWRDRIKQAALCYVMCHATQRADRWFFIGGATGAGKSHICTAIAGEMLKYEQVLYVLWPDESALLKACITDGETYARRMQRLKTTAVIYLDDLFKIVTDVRGEVQPPSAAEIRLVHELLNYRYAVGLKTIISSERLLPEIIDVDQAIGGRISERARGYILNISRVPERDYRIRLSNETL